MFEMFMDIHANPHPYKLELAKFERKNYVQRIIWKKPEGFECERDYSCDGVYGVEYKPPMAKNCSTCLSDRGGWLCEFQGIKGGIDRETGTYRYFHGFKYKNCPDWIERD